MATLIHPHHAARPDFFIERSSGSQAPSAQSASTWNRLAAMADRFDLLRFVLLADETDSTLRQMLALLRAGSVAPQAEAHVERPEQEFTFQLRSG